MNRKAFVVASLALLITGCANLWQDFGMGNSRQGVSSSLVDYLYPGRNVPPEADRGIPNLKLPLTIGLAFVPSNSSSTPGLTEAHKAELLEKVKSKFSGRDFIKSIQIVPETYLKSSRGFDSVDQIARLYGLDVVALVSYDQVAHSDDTKASIFYWTIVGAYLVKGTKNDVQTFVDTAVFDVRTHKLLLRAPGIHKIEATATLINSPEELRKNRETSFELAISDMTKNLDTEIDVFKERIKKDQSVTITRSSGGGGGGSFGWLEVCTFACFALVATLTRTLRKRSVC